MNHNPAGKSAANRRQFKGKSNMRKWPSGYVLADNALEEMNRY